ncbi:hypothetical protein DTL42_02750 [Bremerella cremea]|uniref:DUF4175 family protein n=2 Tax=Bremerella cremea TaxID=1031537 RepID=A0A368KUM2_9BACT|nr:hypothetical protein DTL42_02750 [Bremerella cremea]
MQHHPKETNSATFSGAALAAKLREVAGRHLRVHLLVAAGWGLIALACVLAITVWLDLLFDLAPEVRAVAPYVAIVTGIALVAGLLTWRKKQFSPQVVARCVDTTAEARGVVLTGWSLLEGARRKDAAANEASTGLTELAITAAAQKATAVSASSAVPLKPAARPWLAVLGIGLVAGIILLAAPGWVQTEWNRFVSPWSDIPPASSTQLVITPGDVDVRWGDPLDVFVEVAGDPVDNVELVLTGESREEEVVPLFQEADGRWRTVLTRLTEPAEYHARAFQTRSRRHQISILTVPNIADVQVEVIPPEYAQGLGGYSGPLPTAGLAGLAGTRARLTATSQRPLEGGEITWIAADESTPIAMTPVAGEASKVEGEFIFQSAGKFELRVRDIEGQFSRDVVAGTVALKTDQRPFIRIMKPRPVSLATPEAYLPIEIAAEDDYGLSRVEIYRSLNDSRALPLSVPVGQPAPRRQYDAVALPLSSYGLQAGDQIKLYARCEDNDPSGAKGAETPVATVHIISQEEYERMHRAREGLNVLMSKYRQAERMLQQLREQAKQLQQEQQQKKGLVSKKSKEDAQKLADQLRKNAEELAKAVRHQLPYQTDEELSKHLENLAKQLEQAANQLEQRLERLEGKQEQQQPFNMELTELMEMLGQQSDLYNESAIMPLQRLEQVMPLMIAKSRFEQLVKAQRDLANRLASLKGRDQEDNPALKARMRDLQEEQKRLREELESLITDIKDAALQLPDEEDLRQLKETAEKFSAALSESGAGPEMDLAEQGLAQFSGTEGHEHAEKAAQALEELLSDSESMQGQGQASLAFQPSIQSLSMTAGQIIAEMGLGGGGSGFSSRSTGNPGLYGDMPALAGAAGRNPGEQNQQGGGFGNAAGGIGGENPNADSIGDVFTPGTAGSSSTTLVPLRYRERVGQYFRRLSTELQEMDAYPEEVK